MKTPSPGFGSVFKLDLLIAGLEARDKAGTLHEMVARLIEKGAVAEKQSGSLFRALMKREELGSTAIGRGLAVPHAKHSAVPEVVGVLAVSREGVQFDALDGQPVHVVLMVVSPADAADEHIQVLRMITRLMQDDDFCRFLMAAGDVNTLAELVVDADERLARAVSS